MNQDELRNEDVLKNCPPTQQQFPPSLSYYNITWFFLRPLTLTATPQMMLNRKCYQVSKPEMEFHMIDMIYAALPMGAQTEKTTFSCKDD